MTTILAQPARLWLDILWLALAVLLAKGTWFSASAVAPALTAEWRLDDTVRAWLTMSVQLGFTVGAFGSAALGLADRWPTHWFFAGAATLAALCTALIALFAEGPGLALPLRFLTGMALAGVYPVGMKIMATWTQRGRGLVIGVLVGALTFGSASPHLLNVLGGIGDWRRTLLLAAGLAALGGVMVAAAVREGPLRAAAPRFSWAQVVDVARERPVLLANLGYLGHMWELYAAWAWLPLFLLASFEASGVAAHWAGVAAFAAIAMGGLWQRRGRRARRPAGAHHNYDRGDGHQRRLRTGDRTSVRWQSVAGYRFGLALGLDRRRRFSPILGGGERTLAPRTHRHRVNLANQLGLSAHPDYDLAGAAAGDLGWLAVGLCWVGAWAGDWHLGDGDAPALAGGGTLGWRARVRGGPVRVIRWGECVRRVVTDRRQD